MARSLPYPLDGGKTNKTSALTGNLSAVLSGRRWLAWAPLIAVVVLALAVNAIGLDKAGWGNTYYAAAARSMTVSWKNFFFGALDAGGFITVDKPPVFLW